MNFPYSGRQRDRVCLRHEVRHGSLPTDEAGPGQDRRGVLRREPGQEGRAEEGAIRQLQPEGGRQDVL